MVEEILTEEERQAVKESLLLRMAHRGAPHETLFSAMRKIEGVDTVVVCRRAYRSKAL